MAFVSKNLVRYLFPAIRNASCMRMNPCRAFSSQPTEPSEAKHIDHDFVHFKASSNAHPLGLQKHIGEKETWNNPMQHSVWTDAEIHGVQRTHKEEQCWADKVAYKAVQTARFMFDTLSFYKYGELTTAKVINRAIFLETVAGVPGMCAAMLRHLRSLRNMDRDHGWIHTLLEEAENERMHLLTFVKLRQPGYAFRTAVVLTQGIFMNAFFFTYLVKPQICHRFVGYLEEEAVKTYTDIIAAIDDGRLGQWKTDPAPQIAIDYWKLREDATMRDLMLAVRADEANHRDVNHTLADLKPDEVNPYIHEHVQELQSKP